MWAQSTTLERAYLAPNYVCSLDIVPSVGRRRFTRSRIHTVIAPSPDNARVSSSAGIDYPRILHSLPLIWYCALRTVSSVASKKSVPLGKHYLTSPLAFSLVSLCEGLYGSQKLTPKPVAPVNSLQCAISTP